MNEWRSNWQQPTLPCDHGATGFCMKCAEKRAEARAKPLTAEECDALEAERAPIDTPESFRSRALATIAALREERERMQINLDSAHTQIKQLSTETLGKAVIRAELAEARLKRQAEQRDAMIIIGVRDVLARAEKVEAEVAALRADLANQVTIAFVAADKQRTAEVDLRVLRVHMDEAEARRCDVARKLNEVMASKDAAVAALRDARADLAKREAERDEARKGLKVMTHLAAGSVAAMDSVTAERDALAAENARLREVVDAAREAAALFCYEPPVRPPEIRRLREALYVLDEKDETP